MEANDADHRWSRPKSDGWFISLFSIPTISSYNNQPCALASGLFVEWGAEIYSFCFGIVPLQLFARTVHMHMRHSTFPRSGVLILGPNTIQSLLPSTLISQAESLLESHRIEDAVSLVDQQRKKIEGKLEVDDDEVGCIMGGVVYSIRVHTDYLSVNRAALRLPADRLPVSLRNTLRGSWEQLLRRRLRSTGFN